MKTFLVEKRLKIKIWFYWFVIELKFIFIAPKKLEQLREWCWWQCPHSPQLYYLRVHPSVTLGLWLVNSTELGLWLVSPGCISWSPLTSHCVSITQLVLNDKSLTTLRTRHRAWGQEASIAGFGQSEATHWSQHHYPPGREIYLRQEWKKRNGEPEKVEVQNLFQFLLVYILWQEQMETNGQPFK